VRLSRLLPVGLRIFEADSARTGTRLHRRKKPKRYS